MKTKKQIEAEKRIEECQLDTNQRAKDTIEYEQMLMKYIEQSIINQDVMEY